mmetsp:Transcript_26687/g.53253  ORF Transcript_26687/g.53253 Transcript_26687/m.53253 type:complete len:280 (+) Transcript_26687:837-1676(+)
MRSSARSLLSWSGSTGALRLGSRDISTWDKITRIPLLSPPSTPRTDPTPTAAPASLPKPPSCAPGPPATVVNNPVSSAETRTDSKSAPSTTKRTERSAWMPPLPTAEIATRSVSTLTRTRRMITTVISRSMLPVPVISCTLRMMVSAVTTPMETLNPSTWKPTPSHGGTCPADAPSECSTETSSNTTPPPSPPSVSSSEPTNSSERKSASSTPDSTPIPANCFSTKRKEWRERTAPPWPEIFANRPWFFWTRKPDRLPSCNPTRMDRTGERSCVTRWFV